MKEYAIASGKSKYHLYIDVNRYLDDGWKCQGGAFQEHSLEYLQAMVREVKRGEDLPQSAGDDRDMCPVCGWFECQCGSAAELVVCPNTMCEYKITKTCSHSEPHIRHVGCATGSICPGCIPVSEDSGVGAAPVWDDEIPQHNDLVGLDGGPGYEYPVKPTDDEAKYEVYVCRQQDRMKLHGSYSASQIREGLGYWFAHEDGNTTVEVKSVPMSAADFRMEEQPGPHFSRPSNM